MPAGMSKWSLRGAAVQGRWRSQGWDLHAWNLHSTARSSGAAAAAKAHPTMHSPLPTHLRCMQYPMTWCRIHCPLPPSWLAHMHTCNGEGTGPKLETSAPLPIFPAAVACICRLASQRWGPLRLRDQRRTFEPTMSSPHTCPSAHRQACCQVWGSVCADLGMCAPVNCSTLTGQTHRPVYQAGVSANSCHRSFVSSSKSGCS